jgi:hypothetical protein
VKNCAHSAPASSEHLRADEIIFDLFFIGRS